MKLGHIYGSINNHAYLYLITNHGIDGPEGWPVHPINGGRFKVMWETGEYHPLGGLCEPVKGWGDRAWL